MHINYFGDSIAYVGLALITLELVCLLVSIGIIVNFIVQVVSCFFAHLPSLRPGVTGRTSGFGGRRHLAYAFMYISTRRIFSRKEWQGTTCSAR